MRRRVLRGRDLRSEHAGSAERVHVPVPRVREQLLAQPLVGEVRPPGGPGQVHPVDERLGEVDPRRQRSGDAAEPEPYGQLRQAASVGAACCQAVRSPSVAQA